MNIQYQDFNPRAHVSHLRSPVEFRHYVKTYYALRNKFFFPDCFVLSPVQPFVRQGGLS